MDYDLAYANAEFIPNANAYPTLWATAAAEFRAARLANAHLGLAYGPAPRQKLDLFLPDPAPTTAPTTGPNTGPITGPITGSIPDPDTAPRGLVVFVHGGYWRAFGRADWSHLAAGAVARGWAVALPSYTLAPEAHIRAITAEITAAISFAASQVPGPIHLVGHSAGGQLVARMNCADTTLPAEVAARIARIVAISPVADLRPLLRTRMNADLRLTPAEATAESPVLATARRGIDTLAWVGAEERPAFLDQAIGLAEAWDEARLTIAPGRHHFDVIEPLASPASDLTDALLA